MNQASNSMECRGRLAKLCAADLMTRDPVTIPANATVREAVTMLTDLQFSGAPVVDRNGLPIGVVSRTDIVRNDREAVDRIQPSGGNAGDEASLLRSPLEAHDEFLIERVDETGVQEIMTPLLFSVELSCKGTEIVTKMLEKDVHRVFVVDEEGALVGVISSMDILRELVN